MTTRANCPTSPEIGSGLVGKIEICQRECMCLAQIFEAPKFSVDLFQIQNSLILARTYTIFAEVAEIQPVQHHPQVETLATWRDMIKFKTNMIGTRSTVST